MNEKLKSFASSANRTANLAIEAMIKDLTSSIKDKTYARQKNLPKLIDIHHKFLLDPPVLTAPNDGDVSTTVHIIAELQSRLSYMDFRLLSGCYDEDYNMRIKVIHAIMRENEILHAQMDAMASLTPAVTSAQNVEDKVTSMTKAKAAS